MPHETKIKQQQPRRNTQHTTDHYSCTCSALADHLAHLDFTAHLCSPTRLLEAQPEAAQPIQLEAAVRGRFEGLLGVVVEVVVPQPATGRCKREGARAHATHPWAKEGVAAVHAGCAGVGGGCEGVGAAASKRCALCMCRLCVGCARAGLIRGTRREWLVAFKARAGRCGDASKERGRG